MAYIPTVAEAYGGDPMLTDGDPTPNNPLGKPKPNRLADRHEQYVKAIDGAIAEGARGDTIEVGRLDGAPIPLVRSKSLYQKELARGFDNAGLLKGHRADVAEHLEFLQKSSGDLRKEWTRLGSAA